MSILGKIGRSIVEFVAVAFMLFISVTALDQKITIHRQADMLETYAENLDEQMTEIITLGAHITMLETKLEEANTALIQANLIIEEERESWYESVFNSTKARVIKMKMAVANKKETVFTKWCESYCPHEEQLQVEMMEPTRDPILPVIKTKEDFTNTWIEDLEKSSTGVWTEMKSNVGETSEKVSNFFSGVLKGLTD